MTDFLTQIKDLYIKYQYKFEKAGDNYAVFSYGSGVYPGVDILVNSTFPIEQFEAIKKDYSEAGYATKKVDFSSIENLENSLFNHFFRPENARRKLLEHYDQYTSSIIRPYINNETSDLKYKYIEVGYNIDTYSPDGTQTSATNQSNLKNTLYSLVKENGAKLIIVEAPAGFGKTSTAYELLQSLCHDEKISRPFFMELAKDRSANTFRYLLLSQIEQNFEVQLKNNLVVDNIKSGRIPLIIDGFDELLSQDLKDDISLVKFDEVETMLSTIGELLTDKSTIILTTRKTALFSGEQFVDWYFHQLSKDHIFTIHRIQLQEPKTSDWISKEKLDLLPETISKITNPVLLSYIRYTPIENLKHLEAPEALLEHYFQFLFARERTRQGIPFKDSEQKEILMKLASYFGAFDITADTRKEVSNIIAELNRKLITEYSTPDKDEGSLVNALTNHALLDRKASGKVGFINDFIFGSLLGNAVISIETPRELEFSPSYSTADKIIEACSIWETKRKQKLADALNSIGTLSSSVLFGIDRYLRNSITREYKGLSFTDEVFHNLGFSKEGMLTDCTFIRSSFRECDLDFEKISNCTFISCEFLDSIIVGNYSSCFFYNCSLHGQIESNERYEAIDSVNNNEDNEPNDLKIGILQKFYRKGSSNTRIKHISSIIGEFSDTYDKRIVIKCLDEMKRQRYIYVDGDIAWITKAGSERFSELTTEK